MIMNGELDHLPEMLLTLKGTVRQLTGEKMMVEA
jgi:hypothetical protein